MAGELTGKVQAFNHLDLADAFAVDKVTREVSVEEFDALVLPGGAANADQLRTDAAVTVCTGGPNVLVTSRKPDDLPAFNREAIIAFGAGRK